MSRHIELSNTTLEAVVKRLGNLQLLLIRAQLILLERNAVPDSYDNPLPINPAGRITLRRLGTKETSPKLSKTTIDLMATSGTFRVENYNKKYIEVTADAAATRQAIKICAKEIESRVNKLSITSFSSNVEAGIGRAPAHKYTIANTQTGEKLNLWSDMALYAQLAGYLYQEKQLGELVAFDEIADELKVSPDLYSYKYPLRKDFDQKTAREKREACRQASYRLNHIISTKLGLKPFLITYASAVMRIA